MRLKSIIRRFRRFPSAVAVGLLASALPGCQTAPVLAPTPYVMLGEQGRAHFDDIPQHLQTPEIPILYWTDRQDDREPGADNPVYGPGRSGTTSFGVATITPRDPDLSWSEFMELSLAPGSHADIKLKVDEVVELGELASPSERVTVKDGDLYFPPEAIRAYIDDIDRFQGVMEPWLDPGDDNAAIVFVHGFNNSFDGAALRLAKTWHAIGRDGVPILFTWPAGFDAFKPIAYNHDRESGEFAVQSLKGLLISLAVNERISRVHIIAHSRGTDVASTALREIEAEISASLTNTPFAQVALGYEAENIRDLPYEREPADVTKIETFTLVAADIDLDVFMRRTLGAGAARAARRTSIYTSSGDKAIRISDIFSGSDQRLGRVTFEDFPPNIAEIIGQLNHIEFIECRVKTKDSHVYLFEHPAALSDMVLSIRERRRAGADNGRPLEPVAPNFWILDETYLRPE
jgi:esterase/lipase superfamily enzyme